MALAWRSLLKGFWINVQVFLIAEVIVLVWALVVAVMRLLPGPACQPVRFLATVYVDVFRGVPAIARHPASSASGCRRRMCRSSASFTDMQLRHPGPQPDVRRLRVGGVPRRHRVDPLEPDRGGPIPRAVVLADDAPRRGAASRSPGDPATAQRLHRTAEGHLADRRHSVCSTWSAGPGSSTTREGTLAAYSMAALLFLLVTIPFTRWLDGLIRRQQARTLAGRS